MNRRMRREYRVLDGLLNHIECVLCGWWVRSGTGTGALAAGTFIHHCPTEPEPER